MQVEMFNFNVCVCNQNICTYLIFVSHRWAKQFLPTHLLRALRGTQLLSSIDIIINRKFTTFFENLIKNALSTVILITVWLIESKILTIFIWIKKIMLSKSKKSPFCHVSVLRLSTNFDSQREYFIKMSLISSENERILVTSLRS